MRYSPRLGNRMENLIRHVSEPDRLVLAWQASDEFNDRHRWAVGELLRNGGDVTLRYFDDEEIAGANRPDRNVDLLKSYGYRGYPAFSPEKMEHGIGVLEAFMRRLPPRNRADFEAYRRSLRLHPDAPVSDFALLGLSEVQLPSDGFSVVDSLKPDVEQCELLNEIAGYRYYAKDIALPPPGTVIELEAEPDNKFDTNAVAVTLHGRKIGNINRLQTAAFRRWISERRVRAVIDHANGRPDRPRVFMFVSVSPVG